MLKCDVYDVKDIFLLFITLHLRLEVVSFLYR